ncbi:hypothetical protein OAG63_00635 [Methylacidiphilales bacterium]|nr:hypothetical protein [Candidatus Methylacidiphilales bacterium]
MQSESAQQPPDNAERSEKALLQLAESFDPGAARRSVLHQYKRGVLLLRAKHATYDKIVAMLKEVGVKTSIFSVSRFCRQYRAEIKKLRVQLESRKPPAEASEPLLQARASFASDEQQQPTTRKKRF